MRLLPAGWRIAIFPEPDRGLDITGPDGQTLLTVAPGDPVPEAAATGPWPAGSRREAWFLTPSGRRCGASTHLWRNQVWEQKAGEVLVPARIRIDVDWGNAYAWTEYGECAELDSFFVDEPGVLGLEAAFKRWQDRFEETAPWDGNGDPQGGWEPFREEGLTLCLDLAAWIGTDGYVLYQLPPRRMGLESRRLMIAWEPD
jgi:hypothetical protein